MAAVTTPLYLALQRLTPHQRAVLELVREAGTISTVEAAARLGVARQSVVKALKALEREGLLEDPPRVVRSGKWQLTTRGKMAPQ